MILLRGLCVCLSVLHTRVFIYIYIKEYCISMHLPRERKRRRCFPSDRECRAERTFDQQSGMKRC